MPKQAIKRKLTAILAADVFGYSRMMGEDEEGTLATLDTYREVMDNLVDLYRGRVVGSAGDSLLADFTSVVDAVQCAVEIQRELAQRNSRLPNDQKMLFRIGINLGDVMIKGDDIFGDGVNIAARLESLAEPGGICVSGGVYEQLKNKLALNFQDLGKQNVKNISDPVQAYQIGGDDVSPEAVITQKPVQKAGLPIVPIAAIVAVLAIAAVAYLLLVPGAPVPVVQSGEKQQATAPTVTVDVKEASLAVLPFVNMSGDEGQDFFVDGITESLITDLSKLEDLQVISRTSSFAYKGKSIKVQQVGQELGVRYILEGSVQKYGNKVRINAQLIEASSDRHLWAERFDRELTDVFAVQDDIAKKVVIAIAGFATSSEAKEKFYQGRGRIVEIEDGRKRVVLDHEAIEGFMASMTMGYRVANPSLLEGSEPGMEITFTISATDRVITAIKRAQ